MFFSLVGNPALASTKDMTIKWDTVLIRKRSSNWERTWKEQGNIRSSVPTERLFTFLLYVHSLFLTQRRDCTPFFCATKGQKLALWEEHERLLLLLYPRSLTLTFCSVKGLLVLARESCWISCFSVKGKKSLFLQKLVLTCQWVTFILFKQFSLSHCITLCPHVLLHCLLC